MIPSVQKSEQVSLFVNPYKGDLESQKLSRVLEVVLPYLNGKDIIELKCLNRFLERAITIFQTFPLYQAMKTIPDWVNLKSDKSIDKILGKHSSNKQYLMAYQSLLTNLLGDRFLTTRQYGRAFPVNYEIFSYLVELSKDKQVLEIAGASGENAMLLALSGAKNVNVNDIDKVENERFLELKRKLPEQVQKKVNLIPGSALDILNKNPNLIGKVDVILCRNLIHFFNNKQQKQLLDDVKQMLTPKGKAVFMVNSAYTAQYTQTSGDAIAQHPMSRCFKSVQLLADDHLAKPRTTIKFSKSVDAHQLLETDCDLTAYKCYRLYERKLGGKWTVYRDEFQKIDSKIKPVIQNAVKDTQKEWQPIKDGSLRYLENALQVFTLENLTIFFQKHGFRVETTFVTSSNGHIVPREGKAPDMLGQIGIIVSLDSEEEQQGE